MAKKTNNVETITKVNGEVVAVRQSTVEEDDALVVFHKKASQINAYKQKQELVKEIKEYNEESVGAFVHLIFKYGNPIFRELEEKAPGSKNNIHVVRFMMLTTCLTFGGKLFDSNNNRIKKSSLKNIWDTTSKNSINETYNLLKECGYIYETEEGYLMLNEDLVVKGEIINLFKELQKQDGSYTYKRVFVDSVKDMYYNTESKQRKQLANLFKILPYINFKYNVFCSNPAETDETKVKPLTWTDLARLCGYDETKVTRFKKDLINISIQGRSAIGQFETRSGKVIVVNPKIYYGGDNMNDVKRIQNLFDWADGQID